MEIVAKITEAGTSTASPDFQESLKTDELDRGRPYRVYRLRTMKTRFGQKLMVEIDWNGMTRSYFLPNRINKSFTNEQLEMLGEEPEGLFLIYEGRADNTYKSPIIKMYFKDAENEVVSPTSSSSSSDDEEEIRQRRKKQPQQKRKRKN